MDNDTPFAALARRLGLARTRRAILGGGLAALSGAVARQDVRAGGCSRSNHCPPCHRCRKRRCKRRYDGAACDGGTCLGGVCAPPKTMTHAAST